MGWIAGLTWHRCWNQENQGKWKGFVEYELEAETKTFNLVIAKEEKPSTKIDEKQIAQAVWDSIELRRAYKEI
jgi:hypothetical protein